MSHPESTRSSSSRRARHFTDRMRSRGKGAMSPRLGSSVSSMDTNEDDGDGSSSLESPVPTRKSSYLGQRSSLESSSLRESLKSSSLVAQQQPQPSSSLDSGCVPSASTDASGASAGISASTGSSSGDSAFTEATTPAGHLSRGLYSSADYSSSSSSEAVLSSCSFEVKTPPHLNKKRGTPKNQQQQQQQTSLEALAPPDLTAGDSTSVFSKATTVTKSGESKADSILHSLSPQSSPSRRKRVPGGAAAKLMLMGPKESNEDEDDDKSVPSSQDQQHLVLTSGMSTESATDLHEIDEQMQQAKAEFAVGSKDNRRYRNKNPQEQFFQKPDPHAFMERRRREQEQNSEAPSFLNRSEIFHETAAAAVVALLKPRDVQPLHRTLSGHDEVVPVYSSGNNQQQKQQQAAPQPQDSSSSAAPVAVNRNDSLIDSASYESPVKRDVGQTLLSERTERRLESLQSKMRNPTKTLTDLLTAIASPEDGNFDLGYMVRRKNACGALHVLTATAKNRIPIGWTLGVLPALTSVLVDGSGTTDLTETFPDRRIRAEYQEARNRAIGAITNLSMPKENRMAVFHTPRLVQTAITIVLEDDGVARRGCCTLLAYLGKSPENRLLMAQVPGLLDALSRVLGPKAKEVKPTSPAAKKANPWPSGESSDEESEAEKERKESQSHSHEISCSKTSEDVGKTSRPRSDDNNTTKDGYDEQADEMLKVARQNAFALLHHLLKEKDNAYHFARDYPLVWTLVEISKFQESPSHVLALKMLANLTRHRLNTKTLVFQKRIVVPALVAAISSPITEARLYACYALQNIAQDKSCRQELATTENLIVSVCDRARHATDERLAAVSILKNLCDEPANLIPMTNAPDAVSALMHLAHDTEEGAVTELMQYRACDALATLSHWLRKIATSGQALDAKQTGKPVSEGLCVPSLRVVTWNQWQ